MRKSSIVALSVAAMFTLACGAGGAKDAGSGASPARSGGAAASPVAEQSAPAVKGIGDGDHQVPADIKPGTYVATASGACYWARLKDNSGELTAILANENAEEGAHLVVTIGPKDKVFSTQDCGTWVPATATGPKATTFGEGTWRVGVDVAPGTYATVAEADCYWARVKNFTGGMDAIIANANKNSGAKVTVTIKATDKGFVSRGCGTWKKA
jgi:hypothetical protein